MFERYTEEARRTLFFSRYEATATDDASIEPEHLLLGIARIDRFAKWFGDNGLAAVRKRLGTGAPRDVVPTSVEIPFSMPTKRALEAAARIADDAKHAWIGPEHLLAAVASLDGHRAATILHEAGLNRERILGESRQPDGPVPGVTTHGFGLELSRDLGRMLVEQRCRALTDELFIATDQKDWTRARRLFADGPIEVDMSSLAGGAAVTTTADELIAGFRVALHAGKASHHMVSNHTCTVRIERQEADVFCHGYAWNQVPTFPSGEDLWETWGTYDFTLKLSAGEWRITRFRYVSKLTRGNDAVRTHLSES
jgi:hypothetical protein